MFEVFAFGSQYIVCLCLLDVGQVALLLKRLNMRLDYEQVLLQLLDLPFVGKHQGLEETLLQHLDLVSESDFNLKGLIRVLDHQPDIVEGTLYLFDL